MTIGKSLSTSIIAYSKLLSSVTYVVVQNKKTIRKRVDLNYTCRLVVLHTLVCALWGRYATPY